MEALCVGEAFYRRTGLKDWGIGCFRCICFGVVGGVGVGVDVSLCSHAFNKFRERCLAMNVKVTCGVQTHFDKRISKSFGSDGLCHLLDFCTGFGRNTEFVPQELNKRLIDVVG